MSADYSRNTVRTTLAPSLRLVPSRVAPKPDVDCITEGLEVALAHARGLGAVASITALEAAWRVWSVESLKVGGAR